MRLHVDTLQARVIELEGVTSTRDGYMSEEIARSLARVRGRWQRERESEARVVAKERGGEREREREAYSRLR